MKRLQRLWQLWLDLPLGIRPAAAGLLAFFVIWLLLMLWPSEAHAALQKASNGRNSVWLSDKPCSSDKILAQIKPEYQPKMRDAAAMIDGQLYRACWIEDNEAAHLMFTDGSEAMVPLAQFKPDGA